MGEKNERGTRPVAPGLFGELVGVAIAAGQQRDPSVQQQPPPMRDPYMQAAIAVRESLRDRPDLFDAVMNRFTALMDLYAGKHLGSWVRTSPQDPNAGDIHPAVIHVASQIKLKKNGRFPLKRFLQAVQEMSAEYPAWDEL